MNVQQFYKVLQILKIEDGKRAKEMHTLVVSPKVYMMADHF